MDKINNLSQEKGRQLLQKIKQRNSEKRKIITQKCNNNLVSFSQRRLWFLDKMETKNINYNIHLCFSITGKLQTVILCEALKKIVERHESLRTVYQEIDGEILQVVLVPPQFEVPVIDIAGLDEAKVENILVTEARKTFDLSVDLMLRATLLRRSEQEHLLLLMVHHIAADGWSLGIISHELNLLYEAGLKGTPYPLIPLILQYRDYSHWQREQLQNGSLKEAEWYWLEQLKGLPAVHSLPLDHPRSVEQRFRGAVHRQTLNEELTAKLNCLSQAQGVTLFMTLQTAFAVLLSRYSNETDIVMGTPVAGRARAELENLVGLFVNTLVLRTDLSGNPRFSELLEQTKAMALNAYMYQDYPFDLLVEKLNPVRSLSYNPVFQIMFIFHNHDKGKIKLSDLETSYRDFATNNTRFDLSLILFPNEKNIEISWEFNIDIFNVSMIESMASVFRCILEDIILDLNKPVDKISFMPLEEMTRQFDISFCEDNCKDFLMQSLQEQFEAQVARTPERVALIYREAALSYRELNARSNRLAHALRHRYAEETGGELVADTLIGLYVERGLEMVTGILAILKAGGAYVPLSPEYPAERVAWMLADTGARLVLTQGACRSQLAEVIAGMAKPPGLLSVDDDEAVSGEGEENPVRISGGEDLAYVIYTSGTTGRPKGVMVPHAGVLNRIHWMQEHYPLDSHDRVLQKTPYTFDVSVWELLWANWTGGAIVMAEPGSHKEPEQIYRQLVENKITTLHFVPTMLSGFCHALQSMKLTLPETVKQIFCSGEALTREQVKAYEQIKHPGTRLHNLYGPTEASIDVSYFDDVNSSLSVIPIGRAISNTRLLVLSPGGMLCPVGVPGELYLGGVGLARGYLNQPALTAERFVPNPFATERERAGGLTRLYRTGDRVRWLPDGTLAYLGRLDGQIKLRGFRIEPGEIESLLRTVPGVVDAVVQLREDHPGEKRLAAYLVAGPDPSDPALLTRCHHTLTARLPDYMHPAAWALLPALPLMPSGKLDWRALPVPVPLPQDPDGYVAPVGEAERLLCDIWQAALHLPQVGVNDNFFTLGGDSILAIQVTSRAVRAGLAVSVRQLFEHKTVRELAAHLGAVPAVSQAALRGEIGLHPVQQRFFAETSGEYHHYNQSLRVSVPADFSLPRLAQLVTALYERHDGLRLRYRRGPEGRWGGQYDETPLALQVAASIQHLRVSGEAQVLAAQAAQRSLSLEKGPLLRAVYFDEGDGGGTLLLVMHHLIVDGVSWRIVLDDMAAGYGQIVAGEAVRLAPKTSGYPQWLARLQGYAGSEALQAERGYWQDQLLVAGEGLAVDYPGAGASLQADSEEVVIRLSAAETGQLLQPAGAAYRTRVDELLLAGVLQGFWRWRGQRGLRVWLEGHGRELLFDELDTSGTLGWFTSVYPVRLSRPATGGLAGLIRQVKETCRAVPHHGIGYGILRYLAGDPVLAAAEAAGGPEVVFNYLGQFDGGEGGLFTPAPGETGEPVSGRHKRHHRLGLNGWVAGGRLHLVLDYSRREYERATMAGLGEAIEQGLQAVIAHCVAVGQGGYTPADFPLMRVSESQLSAWEQQYPGFEDLYPATPMQAGMLYHDQLSGESGGVYLCQTVVMLAGSPDIARLRRAWETVVQRHAVLRTQFVADSEGGLVQMVRSSVSLPWSEADWSGLTEAEQAAASEAWCREDRARGFDVTAAPLMRIGIRACGGGRYRLLWTCHHMLLDGWSGPLVWQEIQRLYREGEGAALPLPVAYKGYIAWLGRQDREKARAFWRTALSGVEGPTPLNVARVSRGGAETQEERTHTVRRVLSRRETARLHQVARRSGTTMSTLLQCAWGYLLHSYSGEETVVFGLTVSGRPAEVAGVEEMVGLLIQTVPVRMEFGEGVGLDSWLRVQQSRQAEYTEYGYLGLSEIRRQSEVSGEQGLFESLLVYENYPVGPVEAGALQITGMAGNEQTNYPLTVVVASDEQLHLRVEYNESRFAGSTARRLLSHLVTVLKGMSALEGEASWQNLRLLSQAEEAQLLGWSGEGGRYAGEASLPARFEAQVRRTPERVALIYREAALSYRELNARSNRLAHALRRRYAEETGGELVADTLIGLYVERGLEMVTGILAILKVGGAYVPLSPEYPAERVAWMLADTGARLVLTQGACRSQLAEVIAGMAKPPGLLSVDDDEAVSGEGEENPVGISGGEDLAYVIYTSGTTGRPKGVMVSHNSLVNLIIAQTEHFELEKVNKTILYADYVFDASVFELFANLVNNVTVYICDQFERKDVDALCSLLIKSEADIITLPAAIIPLIKAESLRFLKTIIVAGEIPSVDKLNEFSQGRRVINAYGPTEVTVCTTFNEYKSGDTAANIGKPIKNLRCYVLDEHKKLLPVGVPGELYIGGAGLARGYLNQPGLTAERFVENPFASEKDRVSGFTRLYRTGDRARWLPEGKLEYLGRKDSQIKLRGFRIDTSEIENILNESESVSHSVVVVREKDKTTFLAAYIVPSLSEKINILQLKENLLKILPEYMIPATFNIIDEIPLTINGKINKSALPEPSEFLREKYISPESGLEHKLRDIWYQVLGRDNIGVNDSLFALGGDSISIMRIGSLVRNELGINLPLNLLYTSKTISNLAREINSGENIKERSKSEIIVNTNKKNIVLSYAQSRMWFIQQLEGTGIFNHLPLFFKTVGKLDYCTLRSALTTIVERHETLRTVYQEVEGEIVQVVLNISQLEMPVIDVTGLDDAAVENMLTAGVGRVFDLASDLMLRATLLRRSEQEHLLLLTVHHIAADGWSLGIIGRELNLLYEAGIRGESCPLVPLALQYANYADWQREQLQNGSLKEAEWYWLKQLEELPAVHNLPLDHPRPAEQGFHGAVHRQTLNTSLTERLNRLSQAQGVTLFMTLQTAFAVLLSRYSNETDIVMGTPVAGRSRVELEDLVGLFVNTLVLRTDLSGNPRFSELLEQTKTMALNAYTHQDYPFDLLVEKLNPARSLSYNPVFQIMFAFNNYQQTALSFSEVTFTGISLPRELTNFDLTLSVGESEGCLYLAWEYATGLFNHDTVERLANSFAVLLAGLTEEDGCKTTIQSLPLLTERERQRVLLNGVGKKGQIVDQGIHHLFETQVQRTPDNVAVVCGEARLTYRELNTRANQVAYTLQEHYRTVKKEQLKANTLILLYFERSVEMIISILGVLKSGGTFVPVMVDYPMERVNVIIEDTGASLILTQSSYKGKLQEYSEDLCNISILDVNKDLIYYPSDNHGVIFDTENLAYIMYTSGTTGRPKGVKIRHRSIVNLLKYAIDFLQLDLGATWLSITSFSFDIAYLEILGTLLAGGRLVLVEQTEVLKSYGLEKLYDTYRFKYFQTTPSVWQSIFDAGWKGSKDVVVLVGGEKLDNELKSELVRGHYSAYNCYGPTECTIWSMFKLLKLEGGESLDVSVPNMKHYVLNDMLQLTPTNIIGELYISGVGVSCGYLNNNELTKEKFLLNPYDDHKDYQCLYQTGDQARWLPDGSLEILGRNDDQIKIMGIRVEPSEIESWLNNVPSVKQSIVLHKEINTGGKQLVAYIASDDSYNELIDRCGKYLRSNLPLYMIPSTYIILKSLPLMSNGKLDRKSLYHLDYNKIKEHYPPKTENEMNLCKLFSEVLNIDGVGINDNFFELGGNSLLAIKLIRLLEREGFNYKISLRELFDKPTVKMLLENHGDEHSEITEW